MSCLDVKVKKYIYNLKKKLFKVFVNFFFISYVFVCVILSFLFI